MGKFTLKITKKQAVGYAVSGLLVAVGSAVMAFGNMAFLLVYDIVPGGFSGFAVLVNRLLPSSVSGFLTVGIISIILNLPLFFYSYRILGRKFFCFSLIGMLGYSLFIDLFNLVVIPNLGLDIKSFTDNDQLLSAICGGTMMGIGYGLIINRGGSTGGSDMLSNVLQNKRPNVTFGTWLMAIDGTVVVLSMILFKDVKVGLYAFITIFITSRIADYVLEGKRSARAYYIFTKDPEGMAEVILRKLLRGVTGIKSRGMYTNKEKDLLLCIIMRHQSAALKRVVYDFDPAAFVFASNVSEVYGEGFVRFTSKKFKILRDSEPPAAQ